MRSGLVFDLSTIPIAANLDFSEGDFCLNRAVLVVIDMPMKASIARFGKCAPSMCSMDWNVFRLLWPLPPAYSMMVQVDWKPCWSWWTLQLGTSRASFWRTKTRYAFSGLNGGTAYRPRSTEEPRGWGDWAERRSWHSLRECHTSQGVLKSSETGRGENLLSICDFGGKNFSEKRMFSHCMVGAITFLFFKILLHNLVCTLPEQITGAWTSNLSICFGIFFKEFLFV